MKGPALPRVRFETLTQALAAAALDDSGLTFVDLRGEERLLAWREVHQRSRALAASLAALGVSPGERVAIVLPTGEDFVEAFFGVVLCGAVPVPLYPPVRLGRLPEYHAATAQMLKAVGARLVLTDSRLRRLLGQPVAGARPALGCRTVESLRGLAAGGLELEGASDALALIQFSSGSTVDPKPVALTHGNLLAQCATLRALFPEGEVPQLGVSWLPLYHDMGLIGALLSAAYYPGPLVLIAPQDFLARPSLWLRAVSRHRATLSCAPNFAYALCLKRI
ncbi:MAG: AMP-binding protein, partial [Myxococcaceae bacterium]